MSGAAWGIALLACTGTEAWADDLPRLDGASLLTDLETGTAVQDFGLLPKFTLGPRAGYLRAAGAEDGAWFGGAQARLRLMDRLAAEGSIEFHQEKFDNLTVTQYPVQVSALLFPISLEKIYLYILAGAGWYYTRFDFDPGAGDDDTDGDFGWHVGGGVEIWLNETISVNGDIRYIFLRPANDDIPDPEDFDYWQITIGLNFSLG